MTITIRNAFHGTQARARTATGKLNARQARRVRKALCGLSGCQCAGHIEAWDEQGRKLCITILASDAIEVEA